MMAKAQAFLFENELPDRPETGGLMLSPQPNRPLTKAQRAFNRLVSRVETLRARIADEIRRLDAALAHYGEHLHPRLQRKNQLRKDLVRALAPFLDGKRLKRKNERETLRVILSEQIHEIIVEDGSLIDDDLRAIFKKVHAIDFEKAERQEIEEARSEMKAMLDEMGIEIDLSDFRPGMSKEEFAAKEAEIAATLRATAEEAGRAFQQPERRKNKRQLEKEERLRQTDAIRKKSLATIYKELAKALHPDLEPDPGRRERKVVLMQELTVAYRNNDLHTLLRLELEWIQHEEGNVERLTEEKLAACNQALKDQVRELERELYALPQHPRYRAIAVADGPFRFRMRANGPAEAHSLDKTIAAMESSIARLRTGEALDEIRDTIQIYLAATPFPAWDDIFEDGGPPF
jgi:predicted DNA-binding protein YlxM (UPF0122 family)